MPAPVCTHWRAAVHLGICTIVVRHDDDNNEAGSPGSWVGAVDLSALDRGIGFVLRRAQAAVAEDFARSFGRDGLRPIQFAVLTVLRHNPGLRQSQVSFALGIKRTNFVPLLDELERKGLAERRRVPGDRRSAALFLTKAGTATLDRLAPVMAAHEARFLDRAGGADNHAMLIGLLSRIADRSFDAD
jgi:DNA-binding MarR family transcriptional regulator